MQKTRAQQDRPKTARKRFRFSLRTLLLVFTVFGFWLGAKVDRARKQKRAADHVRELGGWVLYEYEIDKSTGYYLDPSKRYQVSPYGARWLRELLGPEFFNRPISISLAHTAITDNDLVLLHDMPSLRSVGLEKTQVSDAGMNELAALKNLRTLYLNNTNVSETGVSRLREQFPEMKISYLPGRVFTPKDGQMPLNIGIPEATRLGVQIDDECVIQSIYPDSPADLAGMKVHDKIIAIASDSVSAREVQGLVDRQSFGASLTFELIRSREALAVQVVLDGASR